MDSSWTVALARLAGTIAWCLKLHVRIATWLLVLWNSCDQARQDPCLRCKRQQWSVPYVPNAELTRNLVNSAVALTVVLGSKSVEMFAIKSSSIRGLRAFRLAKVGGGGACDMHSAVKYLIEMHPPFWSNICSNNQELGQDECKQHWHFLFQKNTYHFKRCESRCWCGRIWMK